MKNFLIAKSKITNRHNISPIEVKSSKNYTLASIQSASVKRKLSSKNRKRLISVAMTSCSATQACHYYIGKDAYIREK